MIKQIRTNKQLTLKRVAQDMGISFSYLSHLENGRRGFTPELIEKLAAALGEPKVKVERLVGEIDRNNAIVNSWIASIQINGQPLVKSFRYHLMTHKGSFAHTNKNEFAEKLVSYIVNNIEHSLLTELNERKDLLPQLMRKCLPPSY